MLTISLVLLVICGLMVSLGAAKLMCPKTHNDETPVDVNLASISCQSILGFIHANAVHVADRIPVLIPDLPFTAGLVSAHIHVVAAVLNQRPDCVTESLRFAVMVHIKHVKEIMTDRFKLAWMTIEEGTPDQPSSASVVTRFRVALTTFIASLESLQPDTTTTYYSHEYDGRYSTLESLRITTFREHAVNPHLCLRQRAIKDIFTRGDLVLDIGSGPLADHSVWFNRTGLVTSVAVDGSPSIGFVSEGLVNEIDARNGSALAGIVPNGVDWIWCIDVLDSVIPEAARQIVQSIAGHVRVRKGIVVTWSAERGLNPQSHPEVVNVFSSYARRLHYSADTTDLLRINCATPNIYVFLLTAL